MTKYNFPTVILFVLLLLDCSPNTERKMYKVTRVSTAPIINAGWDKSPWNTIESLNLNEFMGEKPVHFPASQAKIAYDNEAIFVIFRVEDQFVKAIYQNNQDPVYKDSCVEFFFTPNVTSNNGYFNLEMNCGGTMLFCHQLVGGKDRKQISDDHIDEIEVAHSLPEIVDPELTEKTTWVVEYRIPYSILKAYHDFSAPEKGTVWRANLYKCADDSSHPHWITWSPVEHPTPNFHLPDFFGKLVFN